MLCNHKNHNNSILNPDFTPSDFVCKKLRQQKEYTPRVITIPELDIFIADPEVVSKGSAKATTAAGQAHSEAPSALRAVQTSVNDTVPRNFSLGIGAGVDHSTKIRIFEKALATITVSTIRGFLILGLVMVPILALLLARPMSKLKMTHHVRGIQIPLVGIPASSPLDLTEAVSAGITWEAYVVLLS
ncbi:hypothetical protein AJ80_09398 [Polytolypa hystricis UAMH7299]|uniref:Uncharacterized protein n=1 Tax=Polytolypa hystricis (strain UAMH7299) TaxID=1447883 RepID=A0A2B7WR64_POLH7|nr:hypothetical protein AJ80_09398 [Polytolypa hystricis UAMH7299]